MSMENEQAGTTDPQADLPAPRSKGFGVRALIDKFETGIADNKDLKISVTEYIRLVQLEREMDSDGPPHVEVLWIDIPDDPCAGGG